MDLENRNERLIRRLLPYMTKANTRWRKNIKKFLFFALHKFSDKDSDDSHSKGTELDNNQTKDKRFYKEFGQKYHHRRRAG
jgi:hypothetical protein